MKLVAVLFLLVAFTCSVGVLAEANLKTLFQQARLNTLLRREAVLEALSGITPPPVTVATTVKTTVSPTTPKPTPSPALVKAAAAQGVTEAQLLALTPAQLSDLQAKFDAGKF